MIIKSTDAETLNEIRYEVFPTLTAAEVPDAILTRRTILRAANRSILARLRLTPDAYTALDANDPRRDAAEEAVIKQCAHDLLSSISQIIGDSENGINARYAEIDWLERRNILDSEIDALLAPFVGDTDPILPSDYPYAVSQRNTE